MIERRLVRDTALKGLCSIDAVRGVAEPVSHGRCGQVTVFDDPPPHDVESVVREPLRGSVGVYGDASIPGLAA